MDQHGHSYHDHDLASWVTFSNVPSVNDTTTNRVQQPRHGNQDLRFRAAGEVVMSEQTL